MTSFCLTDINIRVPSGLQQEHDAFNDESLLFVEVKIKNEVRRFGPLIRESESSWKVPNDVEISAGTPVIKMTIVAKHDAQPCTEIGSVEIISDTVLAQCMEQVDEITQTITSVGNMPTLEMSYNCFAIPSKESNPDVEAILNDMIQSDPDRAFAAVERKFDDALALDDEEKRTTLPQVALQFVSIYMKSEKDAHLNKAISALDLSMEFIPEGHFSQSMILGRLGLLLSLRARRCATPADINRAISTLQRCTRGEAEDQENFAILGGMLLLRFERFGEVTDLDMCISTCRDVVHLTAESHADKPMYLNNLGCSLTKRFERTGALADIEESISAHKDAVHLTPDGHANKPGYLCNLGLSFMRRFERTGALADIEESISAHKDAFRFMPEGHADKPTYLNLFGLSFLKRFERTGALADIEESISAHKDAVHLTPDGHANKPGYLCNLGLSFMRRFERTGALADIEESISVHKDAVHLTPDGHANKPGYLTNLGASFMRRFGRTGALADIEESISAHKDAVHLTPDGHANKPGYLNNLGLSFMRRFERTGALADIEESISAHKDAVHLTPDGHANKPMYLSNLGLSFMGRFERTGALADIEESISAHKDAVHLTPDGHANKPMYLGNLGVSFLRRFKRTGALADIEEAISAHKDAVHLTPDGHANKPAYVTNLGLSFMRRFERTGALADIEESISAHKDAVHLIPDGHANKPGYLNNLGLSFMGRFERTGALADIEESISAHKDAVHLTPDGHANKPMCLGNLGVSFLKRFERTGTLADIEESISAHKDAVHLTPDGHANKPTYLSNLGNSFMRRFERTGALADIEESISAHKDAVHLTPDGHANKPMYLGNLGASFLKRFERTVALADIEESISAHKDAVHLTPDGHANKPGYLCNLGLSFLKRFECTGALADIEESISAHKDAVHLTPDGHAHKPVYLSNLGLSFMRRFERTGALADIEESISAHKNALRSTPEGHADKPTYLNFFGLSFLKRFERTGALADIEESISAHKDAIRLTPDGHASKPLYLNHLATSFQHRFDRFHEVADLDNAVEQFRLSSLCLTGPPLVRYQSARRWARLASANRSITLFDAYSVAISLLPRLVWLGQTISQRHKALALVGDIGNEAAAAAIRLHRFDIALEWLEASRSVVWGQLLHLRTPVDELRSIQPELADDLVRISQDLDRAGTRDFQSDSSNQQLSESMEQATLRHYRLAERWDSLVEQVRAVRGFEDFLRPKKLPQLIEAAQSGPVITINVHESRCDCLALIPGRDDVIHIPLENFSYEQALRLKRLMDQSLSAAGIRMRDIRGPDFVPRSGAGVAGILTPLWYTIAKPVLDFLGFGVSNVEDPPRIWWCPTGPLSSLPIHAAGIYATTTLGFKVTDFVTSSYTPTLTTLIERSRNTRTSFEGLLAIGQPNTPGQSRLPNASKELSDIQLLGSSDFHIHNLLGEQATIEEVAKGMGERSWVHLACHATQDVLEPTQSAFHLHDGRLTLSRIISNSFPHADFAFLSACQTAKGDDKLPDEAVHLAGGMIAAGYRSVIATMWSIKDQHAPLVASEVYRRLDCGPSPDSRRAAHALHHAAKKLREKLGDDSEVSFLSWIPFIHVGI